MKTLIRRLFTLAMLALVLKGSIALAYYDPVLGRFIQPDTVIPDAGNPQSYNRYAYVLNNPLRYTDPSGHQFFDGTAFLSPQYAGSREFQAGVQQGNRSAAAAGVGSVAALASGGAAGSLLTGYASPGFVAIGSGMIGGVAGDAASQATQMGFGQRQSFSGQEMAVSGLVGGAISGGAYGVSKLVSVNGVPQVMSEPAVHRVATPGKPQFQLRKGEQGLSVFDASKVSSQDVLPHFRDGSQVTTKTLSEIEGHGLTVQKTPGHPDLPQHLQDAHMEIQKPPSMSRDQFKQAIKKLEPNQ